jgi:hypothetical protein
MAKHREQHLAASFIIQSAQHAGDPDKKILSAARDELF